MHSINGLVYIAVPADSVVGNRSRPTRLRLACVVREGMYGEKS